MKLSISEELYDRCPGAALGLLRCRAGVRESSEELLKRFQEAVDGLAYEYTMEMIAKNAHIAATRSAYRALGKSPHEYRGAAEAMLRRIVKGQGLYHINNVVEVNNLISVTSGYSIGSYDLGELEGDIELRRAENGAHYEGIGKGSVNIAHLPVLYDALGAFGNPTSDSRRAMIRAGQREILSVIYSFDGVAGVGEWLEKFAALLEQHCGGSGIEVWTV